MIFKNLPDTTTPLLAENLNEFNKYSTSEVVIGTWIDGKPLYRKVIDIGNLPNNTNKNVAHNISNLGYVTKIYVAAYSGSSYYNTNMTGTVNMYSGGIISARVLTSDIQISTSYDYSSHTGYAIIEYTKTTD